MKQTMTAKQLHIMVKRNVSLEDAMAKFEVESPEEFYELIRRTIQIKPEKFIKTFKERARHSAKASQDKKGAETVENTEEVINNQDNDTKETTEQAAEQIVEIDDIEEEMEMTEMPEQVKPMFTLEGLEENEAEISQLCIALEAEHESIIAERRAITKMMTAKNKAIREVLRILKLNEEDLNALMEEYDRLEIQMIEKSAECASYKELLEEVRGQIKELRKMYILFVGGEIVVEKGTLPQVPEEEIEDIAYKTLLRRPEARELTVKEVMNLAKLLLVVKALENDGIEYMLEFDRDEVQSFYESLIA